MQTDAWSRRSFEARWPAWSGWRWIGRGTVVLLLGIPTLVCAQSRSCHKVMTSEVTLGALSGRQIDSVRVTTASPRLGSWLQTMFGKVHVRTRPDVIRRELLFAPGDTVDTLSVSESMRRLRQLPFLQTSSISAYVCANAVQQGGARPVDSPPIIIAVNTRDAWTTRPQVKISGTSSNVGLMERDVLGSGRSLTLGIASDGGHLGIETSLADPFGFGTGLNMRISNAEYRDGSLRQIYVGRHERSVADLWRASLEISNLQREPVAGSGVGNDFARTTVLGLVGRRLSSPEAEHVVHLLGGVLLDQAALVAGSKTDVLGASRVTRQLVGPVAGLSLASARYDTLTWLLPGHAIVDVPRTIEGEMIVSVGRGRAMSFAATNPEATGIMGGPRPMGYVDAWLGREWLPTHRSRVTFDTWASGYLGAGDWHSATMRVAMTANHAASRGLWSFALAAERITDPDPDVRALALTDRLLAYIPSRSRLAEAAWTASAERSWHLHSVSKALMLDGDVFGAVAHRWDPVASSGTGDVGVDVVGLGFSLMPTHQHRGIVRLDLGFPVHVTPGLARKPRLTLTVTPAWDALRRRTGLGTPQ